MQKFSKSSVILNPKQFIKLYGNKVDVLTVQKNICI